MFHPDDRDEAKRRWKHSLDTGEPYEIEYRLRHRSGEFRWTLGRANPLRDEDGKIIRWVGTCTDIHEAKGAAEQNEVLSRELSHRIKNIFAVIGGLIGLSSRQHPEAAAFASNLRERIAALGRAHECARPHSDQSRMTVGDSTLHGLLTEIMRPYGGLGGRLLEISGDDAPIDDRGATPLALIFHELATNSAKYGALSADEGRISIQSRRDGDLLLIKWVETGGPPADGVPAETGFGSRLVEISVQQLGGSISRNWIETGLEAELTVLPERLRR
jgi:two-component sensor histidine kinase